MNKKDWVRECEILANGLQEKQDRLLQKRKSLQAEVGSLEKEVNELKAQLEKAQRKLAECYSRYELKDDEVKALQDDEKPLILVDTMPYEESFEKEQGGVKTIADIGAYLHRIKLAEPRFTGRAIKNITDAIKMRAMDIDLPDEWFESAGAFMHKPYDEKVAMISALREPFTIEMVLQEINRYADSEFRYTDRSDATAVDDIIRRERQRERAIREIEAMKREGRWQQ
mgnify:CR=1 FL=1